MDLGIDQQVRHQPLSPPRRHRRDIAAQPQRHRPANGRQCAAAKLAPWCFVTGASCPPAAVRSRPPPLAAGAVCGPGVRLAGRGACWRRQAGPTIPSAWVWPAIGPPTARCCGRVWHRRLWPDGGMPPAPVAVHWEVAEDAAFARIARRGTRAGAPQRAHAVHVAVAGLAPRHSTTTASCAARAVNRSGRLRTLPPPHLPWTPSRLAVASASTLRTRLVRHRHLAAGDHDLVLLHLGDYIYEGQLRRAVRRHETGRSAAQPDPTTARVTPGTNDPDLRAAHARRHLRSADLGRSRGRQRLRR